MNLTKRLLALVLCSLLALSSFTACGEAPAPTEPVQTKPAPTEPAKEAKVMKILTLGSSSSVDSNHMINLVAATEGIGDYEEIVIGTLYYSGCSLSQHVKFLTEDASKYTLYLSSTATAGQPPATTPNMSMKNALRYDYWDIIVLQGSNGQTDKEETYTNGDIETIKDYVNQHKLNPLAQFAWHFTGVPSTDPDLLSTYPYTPNPYITQMEKYNFDRPAYFAPRAANIEKFIAPDDSYKFIDMALCAVDYEEDSLNSFVSEQINSILAYDKENGTDYFHTLHVFLQSDRSFVLAAKKLFTHKNTVAYRIGRMKELFNLDLSSGESVFPLLYSCMLVEYQNTISSNKAQK